MDKDCLRLAILGMGPRGLSVLERLCANIPELSHTQKVEIHVVDPHPPGPGSVWRTDQSRHLLMNTVSSQVTLFVDPSVSCEGRRVPGPSLYEWANALGQTDEPGVYEDGLVEEARKLLPDSYPTRAFYGHYLKWVFRYLVNNLPANASIHVHSTRAITLDDAQDGSQRLRLEDGTELQQVDVVILALGHTPVSLTDEERRLRDWANENGLVYITPSNPADVDLSRISGGEPVILRGLGLNFFDYMAEFSIGRGGRFVRREDGKLSYQASGREPKMYAGSRRGVPYHARAENQKGPYGRHVPRLVPLSWIESLRKRVKAGESISFRDEIWPVLSKEVQTVYYTALIRAQSGDPAAEEFQKRYLTLPLDSEQERLLLSEYGVSLDKRWSWERLACPHGDRAFSSQEEFRAWMLEYLRQDVAEASLGNISGPLKSALDSMRDLRNEVRLLVDHGGISGASYRDDLNHWYTPLNAFLSIGPPVARIEQMVALMEAGILEVVGPHMGVEMLTAPARFRTSSPMVGTEGFEAKALIEARLPEIDLRRTTDPLLSYLLKSGQCSPYRIVNADGSSYETGGLAVTERPYRLLDARGGAHQRRFAFGVPTEGVHWVTAAGIRPGVNSVTLADSDAIARTALSMFGNAVRDSVPTIKAADAYNPAANAA